MWNYKYTKLKERLRGLGSGIIAFSGGVDSGLLAKAAFDELGDKAIAVTVRSELYSLQALDYARAAAGEIGIKHQFIPVYPLRNNAFCRNLEDRCYLCKRDLFFKLERVVFESSFKYILDGTNYDDRKSSRPGMKANQEFNVLSPLWKCEFTKKDIIGLAKYLGLSFWNRPADSCLATRVRRGEEITLEKLEKINKAEEILKEYFGRNIRLRARIYQNSLRIEVENNAWKKLKRENRNEIIVNLKKLGYQNVAGLNCTK